MDTNMLNIKCLSIMMVIHIRQQLHLKLNSNNTDPVDTRRKLNVHKTSSERLMYVQFTSCVYWGGWFKKSVAYQKSVYIQLSQIFRLSVSYHYAFLRDKYVSRSFAITFEKISHKKVLLYDSCLVEPQTFSMNLWTKTFS